MKLDEVLNSILAGDILLVRLVRLLRCSLWVIALHHPTSY